MRTTDNISKNLKSIRLVCGMNFSKLAIATGTCRQSVAKYEKNGDRADPLYLFRICDLVNIPVESLYQYSAAEFKRLLALYRGLNKEEALLLEHYRMMPAFQKGYLTETAVKGSEFVEKEFKTRSGRQAEKTAPAGEYEHK